MVKDIVLEQNFSNLCFLGDIHGNFAYVSYISKRFKMSNTAIIQVGDFGMGMRAENVQRMQLEELNEVLVKENNFLFVVRGNHDDPAYFNNSYICSNILLIDDWTILEMHLNGKKKRIFFFGGAISIDRKEKQITNQYWPTEIPKFDDSLVDDVKDINIIVSHTAPDFVEPYYFSGIVYKFAKDDATLLDELQKERREMTYLMQRIIENNKESVYEYYYGHFHFSATNEFNGVKFRLLSIEEICESF